jgi:hypothetical protein
MCIQNTNMYPLVFSGCYHLRLNWLLKLAELRWYILLALVYIFNTLAYMYIIAYFFFTFSGNLPGFRDFL